MEARRVIHDAAFLAVVCGTVLRTALAQSTLINPGNIPQAALPSLNIGAADETECFQRGHAYEPEMNIPATFEGSAVACQKRCQQVPGCVYFGWSPTHNNCHFGAANATILSRPDSIAGPVVCPAVHPNSANHCTTELPGPTWPAHTTEGSDDAWPSRSQPLSLECWPKEPATGLYAQCGNVVVYEDTKSGWPGKCQELKLMPGVTEEEHCRLTCVEDTQCAVWQLAPPHPTWTPPVTSDTCWHGVGSFCYVRLDWAAIRAQRLFHGEVRVLKDLMGFQIFGLTQHFNALARPPGMPNGYFETDAIAAHYCKLSCYSDINCQYWTYVKSSGCWVEDITKQKVAYPLTKKEATQDTATAKETVAGEYIQHLCPPALQHAVPNTVPGPVCRTAGTRYDPPLGISEQTIETDAFKCQKRCASVAQCAFWSYQPGNEGCVLSGAGAIAVHDAASVGGPQNCATGPEAPTVVTSAPTTNNEEIDTVASSNSNLAAVVVSMEFPNISFSRLGTQDKQKLNLKYTANIAQATGHTTDQIMDLKGRQGMVSLSAGSLKIDSQINLNPGQSQTILDEALQGPAFKQLMMQATASELSGGHLAVIGPLGMSDVKVVPHTNVTPVSQPTWFSQNWWVVLIIVLLVFVCLGGVAFMMLKGTKKKTRPVKSREVQAEQEMAPLVDDIATGGRNAFVPFPEAGLSKPLNHSNPLFSSMRPTNMAPQANFQAPIVRTTQGRQH